MPEVPVSLLHSPVSRITKEKDWHGGRLYEVTPCPFNPDHTNACFSVTQHAGGGISAKCFHNSCQGKGWREFRDLIEPGWREQPGEYQAIEAITDPDRLARLCLQDLWTHLEGPTLRRHQDQWYVWNRTVYRQLEVEELDAQLAQHIKGEFDRKSIEAQIRKDEDDMVARQVTRSLLSNVRLAVCSKTLVPSVPGAPCWLGEHGPWPADEVLACPNGLFHLPTLAQGRDATCSLTPRFFSTFALDYEIRLDAPKPAAWQAFLKELWPDDDQAIQALQEWMGYCLTPDTRQQKILMLIGPPRSGKSTIGRVLTALVGADNVTGPPLSSFRGEFGLQPLLGKTLAIVPDARLRGQTDIVAERLLSIAGEDLLTVNRKNQTPVAVKLLTRLVLISNEIPRFDDASGALVSRLIFLRLKESFLGKENTRLTDQLLAERSGILLWAIAGYKSLHERGHFVQPDSAQQMVTEMDELNSPIKAFVREKCVINGAARVVQSELYQAYLDWCGETGRRYPDAKETFGKNLFAAFPWIAVTQPRGDPKRPRHYTGIGLK